MPTVQSRLADTLTLGRAFVFSSPEFPTDVLPIVYGDLSGGAGGISYCPCIDTAAHKYLIADHAVLAAADGNSPTFYVDRVATSPASWTHSEAVNGRTVATVTFGSTQAGKRIGFRGKGKASGATLIENPVTVMEDFLRSHAGLASADLDSDALEAARAVAAAQGYACAGILDLDRSPAATLAEMLACFAGLYYVSAEGKLVLRLDDGAGVGASRVAMHLAARDFERAVASHRRGDLVNQVAVLYQRNHYDIALQQRFQGWEDGTTTKHAASQSLHGVLGPGYTEATLEWPWVRALATVQAVQAVIVARRATSRPRLRTTVPGYRAGHLDVGDFVGFSWPRLYDDYQRALKNQVGVIEALGLDLDEQAVEITLRDLGAHLTTTYPADGTVTADGSKLAGAERDQRDYT
jgi:hypothetical protein